MSWRLCGQECDRGHARRGGPLKQRRRFAPRSCCPAVSGSPCQGCSSHRFVLARIAMVARIARVFGLTTLGCARHKGEGTLPRGQLAGMYCPPWRFLLMEGPPTPPPCSAEEKKAPPWHGLVKWGEGSCFLGLLWFKMVRRACARHARGAARRAAVPGASRFRATSVVPARGLGPGGSSLG